MTRDFAQVDRGAQERTLERTRRPIIAAGIARFGEDETVIVRREGGWIRVYGAHHKADTTGSTPGPDAGAPPNPRPGQVVR